MEKKEKLTLQGLNKEIEFLQEKIGDIMEKMCELKAGQKPQPVFPSFPHPQVGVPFGPMGFTPPPHMPSPSYDYQKAISAPFVPNTQHSPFRQSPVFRLQPPPLNGYKNFDGELDGKLNIEVKTFTNNTTRFCFALAKDFGLPTKVSSAIAGINDDGSADISIYLYGLVDESLVARVLIFDFADFSTSRMFEVNGPTPYSLYNSLKQLIDKRGENNTIQITDTPNVREIRFLRDSNESVDFYSKAHKLTVRLEYFPISGIGAFGYCGHR